MIKPIPAIPIDQDGSLRQWWRNTDKIAECRAKEYKLDEVVKGKAGEVKDKGKGKEEGSDNKSTESEN
jgi:hypothetical protein